MAKAKYKIRAPAWIDNEIKPTGTEVEYDGRPGYNLEPVNKEAEAMYAKYNPQPEGVPQIIVPPAAPAGPPAGWESVALAAGWSPPGFVPTGFVKAAPPPEATTAQAPPPMRATKPAAAPAVAVAGVASGGTGSDGDI